MHFSDMIDLCLYMYSGEADKQYASYRRYFFGLANLLLSPLQREKLDLYFREHKSTMKIAEEHDTQSYVVSRSINNSLTKLKLALDREGMITIEGDYSRLTNER